MRVNKLKAFRALMPALLLFLFSALCLWSENGEEKTTPTQKLEPVFPRENNNLIFIEGEHAVSTNFNKEPILNYSCSGSRTLQLNRSRELQGGAALYAEYVAYIEDSGTYELWYGGTPPGPLDELFPSYSSPFAYTVDDAEPRPVYREDMVVVEEYAPSYYWCLVSELELDTGQHTIRFTVSEKRRYDGRYYFYLDCFFLVRKKEGKRVVGKPVPELFPLDMDNRSRDYPFRAIEDYQILIREESDKIEPYIELSSIYTLLSDYLSALKYLKRALLIDPENLDVLLLIAKNLIWKGDVAAGLENYRELLLKDPKRLDIWQEAGKVAAWTGRYDESISFLQVGLEKFPENLSLAVNLGLTCLWAGKGKEAEEYFTEARKTTGEDYEQLKKLAETFSVNGYPDRAIDIYQEAIKLFADHLELYFLLEETYFNSGDKAKADEVGARIEETFQPSDRLARHLKVFHIKQGLKEQVIDTYRDRLASRPDNLELRETLAQTYFWNGLRKEAIGEYLNILINHAFISLKDMDQNSFDLLELIDRGYLYSNYISQLPGQIKKIKQKISDQLAAYSSAEKANRVFQEKVEKTREKGGEPPVPEGEAPQYRLMKEEKELASVSAETRLFLQKTHLNLSSYSKESERLEEIEVQEKQEEELFGRITQSNRWKWDRRVFLQELHSAQRKGQVLAKYVLGKIYLIEQDFFLAESLIKDTVESGVFLPEYYYGLMQSLLWQEKIEEALSLMNEFKGTLSSHVPYLDGLKELSFSLEPSGQPNQLDIAGAPEQELSGLVDELSAIEQDVLILSREIPKTQRSLHNILEKKMVRAIYHLQENTYLLRNELGDFYLKEENLGSAIVQFRQVLAIDPWDIAAVYRLGKVYEWIGNWKQALNNYQRVYYADPLYENVTAQYNRLSREHADCLDFSADYRADTSKIEFLGRAAFNTNLNSIFGLTIEYEVDGIRLYNPEDSSTYLIHDLSAGLPIDLYFLKLRIAPSLCLYFLNDLYKDTASGLGVLDFLEYTPVELHCQVDASLGLGAYLDLKGAYKFGRYKETFAPGRTPVYAHSGELELNTNLSFIHAFPFKTTSLRTYGGVDFLSDGNIMGTALQDIQVGILKLEKCDFELKLLGNFMFQDSKFKEETNYYTPKEVLLAGGGIAGSSWISVGEESSLGFYLRGMASSYMENIWRSNKINRVQLAFEGNIHFARGEAFYTQGATFSTTYNFDEESWDYWSLSLSLGYSTSLPKLLAP